AGGGVGVGERALVRPARLREADSAGAGDDAAEGGGGEAGGGDRRAETERLVELDRVGDGEIIRVERDTDVRAVDRERAGPQRRGRADDELPAQEPNTAGKRVVPGKDRDARRGAERPGRPAVEVDPGRTDGLCDVRRQDELP